MIDPNLVSPYVQQWNAGIQQEFKGFVFEARYVGNHVVKQFKQIDVNQINVRQGTYIQDFITGRNNGFLALQATGGFNATYNPAIPGSKPTPFFNTLPERWLTDQRDRLELTSSPVNSELWRRLIRRNNILPQLQLLHKPAAAVLKSCSRTSRTPPITVSRSRFANEPATGCSSRRTIHSPRTLATLPRREVSSRSWTIPIPESRKARAPFDLTHAFKLNHYVPLPFGPGRKYNSDNALIQRIIGGWGASGFLVIQSGPPISILSNRGTLNRGARSTDLNTVDTTLDTVSAEEHHRAFTRPETASSSSIRSTSTPPLGRVLLLTQVHLFRIRSSSTRSREAWVHSSAEAWMVPGFWDYDFSLQKDTKITERQTLQFRADFFNIFNHPNFFADDQLVNSAKFRQNHGHVDHWKWRRPKSNAIQSDL